MLQSSLFCYCDTHNQKISSWKAAHKKEGESSAKTRKVLNVGKEQLCAFSSFSLHMKQQENILNCIFTKQFLAFIVLLTILC